MVKHWPNLTPSLPQHISTSGAVRATLNDKQQLPPYWGQCDQSHIVFKMLLARPGRNLPTNQPSHSSMLVVSASSECATCERNT